MKPVICPTITAYNTTEYRDQIHNVTGFATRIHIDLMDGVFAPTQSPPLKDVWWPHDMTADIHLMYQKPMDYVSQLVALQPHLVIIPVEAHVHHMHFAAELHKHDIQVGLAILRETPIENAYQIMHSFDHVLIFSGHLGYHGGHADLGCLDKVYKVRQHHPDAEISWDGGINDQNAKALVDGGVQVLNVGGFIQKAADPKAAYATLKEVIKPESK